MMMDTTLASATKGQTMTAATQGMGTGPSAAHAFAPAQFDSSTLDIVDKAEADPETPGESTED